MDLAERDGFEWGEVQLLGDCMQPVYVLELPAASQRLLLRTLLRYTRLLNPDTCRTCFRLEATEQGRVWIEEWLQRREAGEPALGGEFTLQETA